MTERELLELHSLSLDLQANGVMSAISIWEMSDNNYRRTETISALEIEARLLMARAAGIREYLEREEDKK